MGIKTCSVQGCHADRVPGDSYFCMECRLAWVRSWGVRHYTQAEIPLTIQMYELNIFQGDHLNAR